MMCVKRSIAFVGTYGRKSRASCCGWPNYSSSSSSSLACEAMDGQRKFLLLPSSLLDSHCSLPSRTRIAPCLSWPLLHRVRVASC